MQLSDNLGRPIDGIDTSDIGSVRDLSDGRTAIRMRETLDGSSFGNGGSQEYTTPEGFDAVLSEVRAPRLFVLTEHESGCRVALDAGDVASLAESRHGGTIIRMTRTRSTSSFNGGQGIEYIVAEDPATVEAKRSSAG